MLNSPEREPRSQPPARAAYGGAALDALPVMIASLSWR
jgi:hypothetical protein